MILGRLGWSRLFTKELINATAAIESAAIPIIYNQGYFSLYWQATSVTGTPDLLFQYEISISGTDTFVIPDGAVNIISNMITEAVRAISFQPIPADWLKLKITGNAANPADTLLDMWLFTN